MPNRREIRRLAMQVLYQIDVRGDADIDAVRESLENDGYNPANIVQQAFDLAVAAWQGHQQADALFTELAPKWPTSRQPPVDRAILRLAYHEIITGRAPAKVAINEAIELAKEYAAEQSPAFINGVLDKAARRMADEGRQVEPPPPDDAPTDPWLRDALGGDD